MNTADDLLRRALEIFDLIGDPIAARLYLDIKKHLDAPEMKDEPVAWGVFEDDQIHDVMFSEEYAVEQAGFKGDHAVVKPLYLHPPRPMKPATDEMRKEAMKHLDGNDDMTMTLRGAFIHGWIEAERQIGRAHV